MPDCRKRIPRLLGQGSAVKLCGNRGMLELQFTKQKRIIKAEMGETIREAAIRNKLSVYPHVFKILNCRGRGLCHACAVKIISGKSEPKNEIENQQLAKKLKKKPGLRLACQVKVSDNMTIETHV